MEIVGASRVGGGSLGIRLEDLIEEVRGHVGGLPLTFVVHGRGPRAESFFGELRPAIKNEDAIWFITSGADEALPESLTLEDAVGLNLSNDKDESLYRNLLGDLVFFTASELKEVTLAGSLRFRARVAIVDQAGDFCGSVCDALETGSSSETTRERGCPAVCLWLAGDRIEISGIEAAIEEKVPQETDLSAIGAELKQEAIRLEGAQDRLVRFRALVERIMATHPSRLSWREDLIRQADAQRWPAWSIQSLGYLCVPLETLPDGRCTALVWHHLLDCIADPDQFTISRVLCGGQMIEALLAPEAADFLDRLVARFEENLPPNGVSSDRAFLGIVAHTLQEVELDVAVSDARAAQQLRTTRAKILAEAKVQRFKDSPREEASGIAS